MAADVGLPEGFVLDAPAAPASGLPPGFVLDAQPPPSTGSRVMGALQTAAGYTPVGALTNLARWAVTSIAEAADGSSRTEHPNASEFLPALETAARERGVAGTYETTPHLGAVARSAVSPDANAQVDILRANIPGLEVQRDRFGNVMLRAPGEGVNDWTYLNRPGFSRRDIEEFGVGTLATAPFLAVGGIGSTLFRRALSMAGALGAGEVTRDVAATAMGSEQGIDPARAAVAAGLGAVTAPGVPTAIAGGLGRVVAAPLENVTAALRGRINPEREGFRRVGTALQRDEAAGATALTDAEQQMAAANMQPVAAIDTGGETTRALARQNANVSPEARGTLDRFIQGRFETQTQRVADFIEQAVGAPANAHVARQAIEGGQQQTLPPLYQAAYRHGAAGVYTPSLEAIAQEPAMQAAMRAAEQAMQRRQASGMLQTSSRGPTGNPTLEYWDQVTRYLRDRVDTLRQSGSREEAAQYSGMRTRLLAELDAAFPSYRNARGAAATFFRSADALEAGEAFARTNFDLAGARTALGQMTPNEVAQFRQGFASHMLERLNVVGDRRNIVTQVAGSPAAREKLEIALGANAARELEAFMRIEAMMDLPRGAMGNSTTTRQLVELGLLGTGVGLAGLNQNPTDPAAVVPIVAAALSAASRRGAAHVDQNVARHIATILTSQDPAVRQRALQQVAHNGSAMRALRSLDESLAGAPRAAASQQAAESLYEAAQ